MIGTIELHTGLCFILERKFLNVVVKKDIKTMIMPSFYVQYLGKRSSQVAQSFKKELYSFSIIYFAQGEEFSELLEIEKELEVLFKKPLMVRDGERVIFVELGVMGFKIVENEQRLECTIEIDLVQHFEMDEYIVGDTLENRFGEEINKNNIEEVEIERSY